SLDGRVHPLLGAPSYHALESLPMRERIVQLRRPEVRERILAELAALPPGTSPMDRFAYVFPLGDPPRYDRTPDESVAAIAARAGTTPLAVAYDALVEPDNGGTLYVPVTNFVDADLTAVRNMLVHPLTVPGLGDAGAHCTMICDGSFPTYLLSYWGLS